MTEPPLWDEVSQRSPCADGGDHSARGDGAAPVLQLDPDAAAALEEEARHARAHEDRTFTQRAFVEGSTKTHAHMQTCVHTHMITRVQTS